MTGLGGYFLNTVLGFVCRMVFVRCLSADYLGVNGLFSNVLTMLSLAELGVGGAIVFALYKPLAENDEEKIASLMALYSKVYKIIGLFIGLFGLVLMPFLSFIIKEKPNIDESIYLLYAINLFNTAISYFFSYRSSLLIAAQRNYIVSGINYIVTIAQSMIQMIVLIVFRNYICYLLIQTVGTILYNIIVSAVAVKQFPYIRGKGAKELPSSEKRSLFSNVRDLMLYKISSLLVNSTDNILITYFGSLATTGVASNYTLLVSTLNSLLGQIFNGLTASVGNHNASESKDKQYNMFSFLNLMNFWLFGWAALGIYFCSTDIVKLCFGDEYVLDSSIAFVMALNFYTVGMMNAVWTYKHTMGLFHYGRFVQLFTGALNLIFSIVLGKCWGLFGILFATFAARLCTNLWYDPCAVYKHGFGVPVHKYFIKTAVYLIVITIAAVICGLVFAFIDGSGILYVLLKMALCSIIPNLVFFVAFFKTEELKMLKSVIHRVFAHQSGSGSRG